MPNAIVAMDPNGVIGADGGIPWHYREDFRRFKRTTMGGALIMGRRTFDSLPKPKLGKEVLPGRVIITMTSRIDEGTKISSSGAIYVGSLRRALEAANSWAPNKVWFAGGRRVYQEAIEGGHVKEIDLTLVPEVQLSGMSRVTYFPLDLLKQFELVSETPNDKDARLVHRLYRCTRSQR